ncbi:MAG: hypothetical protein K2G32_05830 [Oscillospiraceae bacterium]|nr:hypothetical protein [Oscillospiraceae bacterium]
MAESVCGEFPAQLRSDEQPRIVFSQITIAFNKEPTALAEGFLLNCEIVAKKLLKVKSGKKTKPDRSRALLNTASRRWLWAAKKIFLCFRLRDLNLRKVIP